MRDRIRPAARSTWTVVDRFFISQLGEALIEFEGLSLHLRILAVLGYVAIGFLLLSTVVFELVTDNFASINYTTSSGEALQVSIPILAVSSVGFALGWAFVLTGATDGRRRVFLPIVAFYILQIFFLLPQGNAAIGVWFCAAFLLVGGLVGGHFFTHQKALWRDYPLIEFVAIFLITLFFVVLFIFFQETPARAAQGFNVIFSTLALPTVLFWLLSGLAVVDLAVAVARTAVKILRGLFPDAVLRSLTILLLLIRPGLALIVFATSLKDSVWGQAIGFDVFIALPLMVIVVLVALMGKWSTGMAVTFLALSFATPVFTLGLSQAMNNADISDALELALGGLGFFPPLLLFVGLMAHSILSAGASYANNDGKYLPRSGRMLLVFGIALLVTTFTLFFVNNHDAETGALNESIQNMVDNTFGLSLFLLGLPYLLWIIYRRRTQLVGSEEEFADTPPTFAQLDQVSSRRWIAISIAAAIIFSCFACAALTFLSSR